MTEVNPAHVLTSVKGDVGTIILNRPDVLNACNSQTHREIQQAVDRLESNHSVRTIVVRGAGRSFCAGSDLREVGRLRGAEAGGYIQADFATKNRVAGCSKPTIAGIQGHCLGGGLELALACDVRIATTDVSFSLREIALGAIPGSGGLQRLPPVVGLGVAKEWALTGRFIGAQEALDRGLVNQVVAVDALDLEVHKLSAVLAERSPVAVHLAKVAMEPSPPSNYGLTATYHMLASEVCHENPQYSAQTQAYAPSDDASNPLGVSDVH